MDVLLPRPRGKPRQGGGPGTPSRMNSVASDFREQVKEIQPFNEHLESGSKRQAQGADATYVQQPTSGAHPQPRITDDWSHLEPDERGAELAREARVWKVYVEETDRWDKERVEGWDKSMDVLLVFVSGFTNALRAALFSAISGAYLIETSKLLKEDPADVSAAALRAISQVLFNTATNNSAMDPPTLPPAEGSFVPPQVAVIINTLWYMSLSLSIATAFLAMLAKDWCYSFLAHRTGHPRDQAHRRQRKWKLIERWKMEELIIMLPSLMHLSLLLFAVGLCIYLWDLNSTIAIPVMCIIGTFLAFYIWSSIAASIVEDFPYTTIVSRIIRSKYMRAVKNAIDMLGRLILAFAFLLLLGIYCIYLCLVTFLFLLVALPPALVQFVAQHLPQRLKGPRADKISDSIDSFGDVFLNIASIIAYWPGRLCSSIYSRVKRAAQKLKLTEDLVTSLSLGWLIEHCETPSAVDIALQAIAGASHRIPKEPLRSSGATEHIMRRIVSYDPHNEANSRNRLYIRALEILRLNSSANLGEKEHEITGDLEVMIWDLKSKNEREVAELIKDGSFVPSNHNLEAMRIGNSAASQSLRILTGEATSTKQTLCSIEKLLSRHFESEDEELHPAALQSLANASALHLALLVTTELPPGLVHLFMHHCKRLICQDDQPTQHLQAGALLIMCVLLLGHRSGNIQSDTTESTEKLRTHSWDAIRTLTYISVEGAGFQKRILWIGCTEILSDPIKYGLNEEDDSWEPLQTWCSNRVEEFVLKRGSPFVSPWDPDTKSIRSARNKFLRGINHIYRLVEASRLHESTPMYLPGSLHAILTIIACGNSLDQRQSQTCSELLARFGFPRVEESFINCLELRTNEDDRTILAAIGETYTSRTQPRMRRYFAATQLWLLLYLATESYSDDQPEFRAKIESQIDESLQTQSKGFDAAKQDLEAYIIEGYRNAHRTSSKVSEADDEKDSTSIWEKITPPSLKRWTESNTQKSLRGGGGLNRIKSALGINTEDHHTLEKYQRVYTARIVQLILHVREAQDEELISLVEDDFKDLPSYLQNLPPIPASSSRFMARSLTMTEAKPESQSTPEHVAVEMYNPPGTSNSGDQDSDLGIEPRFNDSSEALLSEIV